MTGPYRPHSKSDTPLFTPARVGEGQAIAGDDGASALGQTPLVAGYYSVAQLAAARLPGLPRNPQDIARLARTQGWDSVERVGRGGGRLYAVTNLSAEARGALLAARVAALPPSPVGRPAGTGFFDRHPDIAAAVEAILATRSLSAAGVLEMLSVDHASLPSLRTLKRFIARIKRDRVAVLTSFTDPDAYKSRYRLAIGRADADCTRAHECWELDTTKADVMTRGGRRAILGVIDRWSRRAFFMVCASESAQSVRRVLVEAIRAWGVMPEAVMTDNGSGFINASIRSALDLLGIEHRICPPGSPEKKPHVERLFGTLTRERLELLAGYTGHSVAEAQALRARAKKETGRALIVPELDADQLQTIISAWVDGVYHLRDHGSLGMSPMRKWQSTPVPPRAAPDADALRIALSALVGGRTIGKRGLVWKRGSYWSPALAPWVGREVIVRRDEDELGELLVFSPEGQFIDVARDATRAGMSQREFSVLARQQQDAWMREARAEVRAKVRNFDFDRARDKLLRRDAAAAGKLIEFPGATTAHSTPALDTIAGALPPPVPAGRRGRPVEVDAPPTAPRQSATVTALPRSPAQRMADTDALLARAVAGEPVDAAELDRARLYTRSSEYRAERALAEAFGTHASPARASGENT